MSCQQKAEYVVYIQKNYKPIKTNNMNGDTIICNCNEVYKNEIIKAIEEKGCKTVEDVGEATGAGTICGGCIDDIQEILDQYAGSKKE